MHNGLVGNGKIQHKDILMWCDTAYTYTGTNKVDALGNVHIKQGDSLDIYAQKVFYNGDISFAQASKNVRLINKNIPHFIPILLITILQQILVITMILAKLVDSTNTLTSIIGKYFIEENLIHFYNDVEAYNENYTLKSDTFIYNTETGTNVYCWPNYNKRFVKYTLC